MPVTASRGNTIPPDLRHVDATVGPLAARRWRTGPSLLIGGLGLLCLLYLVPALLARTAGGATTAASGGPAPAKGTPGAETSGNRSPFVHRINLFDEAGVLIGPTGSTAPYSPEQTCGKCHDYATIRHGWHFNASASAGAAPDPGRPGEPWFLADHRTGTQIPLSYRGWQGAYQPADLGLDAWDMLAHFGRHMPGGGIGHALAGPGIKPQRAGRAAVSGDLAIDCMACHSAGGNYDSASRAVQIEHQNFRWAPTAALGLGSVRGRARDAAPATIGTIEGLPELDPLAAPTGPTVVYDKARFDADGRVLLDVVRRPPDARCLACHTSTPLGSMASSVAGQWQHDSDVHSRAGIGCADCHRNGLEHAIVRGFEGEKRPPAAPAAATCASCHLGSDTAATVGGRLGGALGAPRPLHRGLPPIHLEKLSCTACHSGPWPEARTGNWRTSMAHGLGPQRKRYPDEPPLVTGPVFQRGPDGKLTPYRLVYPAFWGRMKDGRVRPLTPAAVLAAAGAAIPPTRLDDAGYRISGQITDEVVATALAALAVDASEGSPVCVAAGKLHELDAAGRVAVRDHPAAEPCAWPIGHDVRPARQSLGVRGCTDCHSADAPMFFGTVPLQAPNRPGLAETPMHAFGDLDMAFMQVFNRSFGGREAFKLLLALAVLLLVALPLGHRLWPWLRPAAASPEPAATDTPGPNLRMLEWFAQGATALGLVMLAFTGLGGWLGGGLHGMSLLTHFAAGPLFAGGLVLSLALWRWPRCTRLRNTVFWATGLTAAAALLPMLLAMTPWLGAADHAALYNIHRWASLVLLGLALVHAALLLAAWRRASRRES